MSGDPASQMHPYGGNLSVGRVHASQPLDSKRLNVEISHRPDQDFLEIAHVSMHVFAIRTEIDDWIADQLAQTVISKLASAVSFKYRHAALCQHRGRNQHVRI